MKFDRIYTGNWENAFHGLRHPMESYDRSDSEFKYWCNCLGPKEEPHYCNDCGYDCCNPSSGDEEFVIGPNDMDLAQRMIKAGTPNDKFLRQIFVSIDITAPLYWWKELDTYKVGTVANSTSTMHKLASTQITKDCFEMDDYSPVGRGNDKTWELIIGICEDLRKAYNETKDVRYWKELIRILPESWLQTRTWTANYSVLRNIIRWRTGHRLSEWNQFIDFCKKLPYSEELLFYAQKKS